MSDYEIKLSANKTVRTCKPALGFAFAAGTTDGEGASMVGNRGLIEIFK